PVVPELTPIAITGEGDAVEAQVALEPGKAGRLPRLDPPKEVLVRALSPATDRLQHAEVEGGDVGTVTADVLELVRLGVVGQAQASKTVRFPSFQQAGIVEFPRHVKLPLQGVALLVRGIEA